jgi:hypothetical protein
MVKHHTRGTRWRRLLALLRETLRWRRVPRDQRPASPPASPAVSSVNEEEIRKRLEGLGYLE